MFVPALPRRRLAGRKLLTEDVALSDLVLIWENENPEHGARSRNTSAEALFILQLGGYGLIGYTQTAYLFFELFQNLAHEHSG